MINDISYVGVSLPPADSLTEDAFEPVQGITKRKVHVSWKEINQDETSLISSTIEGNRTGILAYTHNDRAVDFEAYTIHGVKIQYIRYEPRTNSNVTATFVER